MRPGDAGAAFGLDAAVPWQAGRHEILRLLDVVAAIGAPAMGTHLELALRPSDRAAAAAALRRSGVARDEGRAGRAGHARGDAARHAGAPLVGLHVGGQFEDRMWPPQRFAELARRLLADGCRVALTGAPADAARVAAVVAAAPGVVDLGSGLRVPELAAVLERLDLYVSNDTGPAHLARAVDTPSITLMGAAPPAEWGPLDGTDRHRALEADDPCRPCGPEPCIARIPVAGVLGEARRLLATPREPAA